MVHFDSYQELIVLTVDSVLGGSTQ